MAQIGLVVYVRKLGLDDAASLAVAQPAGHSNTQALGHLLYTQYLYPFEVAAVILLVAMIAAIALTLRQRKDSKAINPSLQVHVRAADRLVVVPMAAAAQEVGARRQRRRVMG